MASIRFPSSRFPQGWFQVGRSLELAAGEVKALKYFNEDLVMWRGESGDVYLQDAFCLHLGAHRGVKGWVCGDDVVCPWHGWQWDGRGRNTAIPYSRKGCKPSLQIKTFPTMEWCGLILAWYSPTGEPPVWEPPQLPEFGRDDFFPMHPYSWQVDRIRAHPQMAVENAVDPAHVMYIHGTAEVPVSVGFEQDGTWCCSKVEVLYGGERDRTRLTPNGPVRGVFEVNMYGIGLSVVRWRGAPVPTIQIVSFTPIDDEYLDYWFQQSSQRGEGETGDEPCGLAGEFLRAQQVVMRQDYFTWENMKYLEIPSFAYEEAKVYAAFRRWSAQFYPEDSMEKILAATE